jgi:hypothetical protein
MRMALGIRSIREYHQSLGGRCFTQCAGLDLDITWESNQQAFCSPEFGWTPYILPIAHLSTAPRWKCSPVMLPQEARILFFSGHDRADQTCTSSRQIIAQ